MLTFVVYDVVSDRVRKKVADVCLDYGLERVQYSAFRGELGANHREEMILKLRRRLGDAEGCVHILPLCRRDEVQVVQIGETLAARSPRDREEGEDD